MVVAPGTYNFTITYTIKDPATNVEDDIVKTIASYNCQEGKINDITAWIDKDITRYDPEYYMWDARKSYWDATGVVQPKLKDTTGNGSATSSSDSRWFNTAAAPNVASYSAKDMPNANLMVWYCVKGQPHWDAEILWTVFGHLYKGGMWYLKKAKIAAMNGKNVNDLDVISPDGYDRRTDLSPVLSSYNVLNEAPGAITQSAPSNKNDYFFLPPLGYYIGNKLVLLGEHGVFWSSNSQGFGYHMTIAKNLSRVNNCDQNLGFPKWTFE